MGIDSYLKKKRKPISIRLQEMTKGKTEKEKRKIEMEVGRPLKIPPYTGELPSSKTLVEKRSIKFVCRNDKELKLVERVFNPGTFKEKSISATKVDPLFSLISALDRGVLSYDKKEKNLYYISKKGSKFKL